MAQTLSLRRLWKVYKQAMIDAGHRDPGYLAVARDAFYSGARGVLMVLDHLAQHGEMEELHDAIGRAGRQITVIRKSKPLSKRRH
jgi:hypothetical protein